MGGMPDAILNTNKRWFCSEEEAQAAGFRKAKNCRE
jgi:methylphosphotriester-DNA--protein-cysteine methyltransferase